MNTPIHLVYRPASATTGDPDRVIGLLQTEDPAEVTLQLQAAPGSIAMLLEAWDMEEAEREMADLGF